MASASTTPAAAVTAEVGMAPAVTAAPAPATATVGVASSDSEHSHVPLHQLTPTSQGTRKRARQLTGSSSGNSEQPDRLSSAAGLIAEALRPNDNPRRDKAVAFLDTLQTWLLLDGVDIDPALVRACEHLVGMSGMGSRSQRMCCVVIDMWCHSHPAVMSGSDVQYDALPGVPHSDIAELAQRLAAVLGTAPTH